MSDRTPPMSAIRSAWAKAHPFPLTTDVDERYAEFDRALAAHDAEVRAGVVAEEPEWEYGWHTGSTVSLIGRRDQVEEWLAVRGWKLGEGDWGSRVMRRRVAGSWMPAEQEGAWHLPLDLPADDSEPQQRSFTPWVPVKQEGADDADPSGGA